MSDDQLGGTPAEKSVAKLILLTPRRRPRPVGMAGLAVRRGANRGEANVSLDERISALAAEINRRWGGAD